jgi:hypothetical protein
MNVVARHILTAVFVTALTASLIRPSFAGHFGSSGRSAQSQSGTDSHHQILLANFRGQSGSRSSGGSSRSTPNNFSRGNRSPNGVSPGTNPSHFNHTPSNNFSKPNNFSKNQKNPYWKKYAGWGKWQGPRHHHIGWGWGCWLDPWCSWPWYEAIPVADYGNPYTDCAGVIIDGIDYSVPISQMPADTLTGDDSESYAAARSAFMRGDLDAALSTIAQAILQMPHNRDLHQFHSLVLYAMKDYCRSATVAYAVLEDGPGWTWNTLQAFYPSPDIYTNQLRSLETFVTSNSSEANVRFLLAYHYLMLEHTPAARRQLEQVVALRPADALAARILAGIGEAPATNPVVVDNGNQTTNTNPATATQVTIPRNVVPPTLRQVSKPVKLAPATVPQAADPDEVAPPTLPQATGQDDVAPPTVTQASKPVDVAPAIVNSTSAPPIAGTWKANPEKKIQIELALLDDGRFNWKFMANGRAKGFTGKYKLNDTALTLTRDGDGDAMEGTIERTAENGFRFRMKDADPGDPGLNFTR